MDENLVLRMQRLVDPASFVGADGVIRWRACHRETLAIEGPELLDHFSPEQNAMAVERSPDRSDSGITMNGSDHSDVRFALHDAQQDLEPVVPQHFNVRVEQEGKFRTWIGQL